MLLHDIGKSPDAIFRRINQHLETNYGFKISEDVSDKDLVTIMEQIEEEITDLKVKGDDAKGSPEISKRLLVLEGVKSLREFALMQFQSPKLDGVVKNLVDYVVDTFEISGMQQPDFDCALNRAMEEYRSSRYRFPDEVIEQRVKQAALARIHADSLSDNVVGNEINQMNMMEDDSNDEAIGDSENNGIEEAMWINTDPNKTGMFAGKSKTDLESQKAAMKKKHENQEGKVSDADRTKMAELNFAIRAKSKGGIEEGNDPFSSVGKRASANGGHAAEVPNTPQARHAMKNLANTALSLQGDDHDDNSDAQIPMRRNPHTGQMQQDPFAAQAAARRKGVAMKEHTNLVKNLRRLLETEVSQAEVMMAAKGFSQELQEMVEKIGRLQNEDLPPVTDQMRETYGMESASAFQTQIYGALQNVMDSLYTAKTQVDDAVGSMASTGQVNTTTDMDKDVGMDVDTSGMDAELGGNADLDNIGAELGADSDMGDEFGGEEALGRSKKMESTLQRKVMEMQKLIAKAKSLKEATR